VKKGETKLELGFLGAADGLFLGQEKFKFRPFFEKFQTLSSCRVPGYAVVGF
jgi:hypothetical protein